MGPILKFKMNSVSIVLVIIGILSSCIFAEDRCNHPPPAENYSNSLYQGRWYEIGKIQTPGGAAFQEGAVCTIATYDAENPENGGGSIGYSSRQDSPDGSFVNATGVLRELDAPGHFEQQLYFYGIPMPSVDYNVIYIDEEVAVDFGYDYCVHVLARHPTLSQEKVDKVIAFAESLGLNSQNLEYKVGSHEGCW